MPETYTLLDEEGDPVLTADGQPEQVVVVSTTNPFVAVVRPLHGGPGSEFSVLRTRLRPDDPPFAEDDGA